MKNITTIIPKNKNPMDTATTNPETKSDFQFTVHQKICKMRNNNHIMFRSQ